MKNPTTVAIETLGCKLNQAESERLARELGEAGCRIVSAHEKADIYVLNTCTVTSLADAKSRHLLRRSRRRNPGACVVAMGCLAERLPAEVSRIEGVDFVLGNDQKADLVGALIRRGRLIPETSPPIRRSGRTRSFVKIQAGCSRFCSYCVVPLVRGVEKSVPAAEVLKEIQRGEAGGCREVVLTGTEIGAYSAGGLDLPALLRRILIETQVPRLRLSSLQPQEVSPELLSLWHDRRLCRHFHISLQSGADSVLQRMGRGYTTASYRQRLEMVRSQVPGAAITTDLIVGFPGENEEEFEATQAFCAGAGFARIHVFPFSVRKGTAAAEMQGQVAPAIKKERSRSMLETATSAAKSFNAQWVGKTLAVLFEQQRSGYAEGLTDNYIRVKVNTEEEVMNRIRDVRITELSGASAAGEMRSDR